MASNLSTIGFVFPDQQTFQSSMMECVAEASARLACAAGEYGIWQSRTGAQVWFHLARTNTGETEILGLTPFFEGKCDIAMNITEALQREGENAFEGAFKGWVNPDDTGTGAYPLVFDAVDFAGRNGEQLPARHRVRLVAFARELSAYQNEAQFLAAQSHGKGLKFATQAFIPTGLFNSAEDGGAALEGQAQHLPSSSALLTGLIREHCLLRNEATGRDFHWLLVETLDGVSFDIVADPEVVKGDIAEGGVIESTVALFGRFLD